jgi:hypothetical protein
MDQDHKSSPFTYRLTYILLGLSCVYVLANITFISHCSPQFYRSAEAGICRIESFFPTSLAVIPAIARPVVFLTNNTNEHRASVVRNDYMFSWASAIVAGFVMALIAIVMGLRADDNDRRLLDIHASDARFCFGSEKELKSKAQAGFGIMFALLAYFLFVVVWGDFDFSGAIPLANQVHVRDSDLYRLGVYWFLFFIFGVPPLVGGAKYLATKRKA